MKFSRNPRSGLARYAFAVVTVLITSVSAFAQDRVPRLDPSECPFELGDWARDSKLECKWLVVPEERRNPKSRTIKLAVVILRARQSDGSGPIVMLHGGPGLSGIRIFPRAMIQARFDAHRDVVIYDQRGAGFSEPKLCPEFKDVESEAQQLQIQKQVDEFLTAGIRKCVSSLDERIERAAYNTRESAADMIDLRQTLGYSSWDIFGDSYGARLAQEAMRRDPKAIRSVVLHKPVTRGPTQQAEVALSNQRAFERVFADCNQQPSCRTAFPTLEKDFYGTYDHLNKTPLSVQIDQSSNDAPVVLDGKRFVDRIRNDVISPGNLKRLAQLPLLLNEFRHGDKNRAARILVGYNPRVTIQADRVILNLVNCYDIYGEQLRSTRKAINAQVRAPFRRDLMEECKLWQKRFADPSEWEPVRSDIPALMLTGRYDDRAPTEQAKRIASTLTRAYVYEFPNEAHGPQSNACHAQILFQFLANPFREPDSSCISRLQPIKFATTWDGQIAPD